MEEDVKQPQGTKKHNTLNILLYTLCLSVIGLVSINFATCNFSIPGTLYYKWVHGLLKNDPKIDCGKIQNDGLNQLLVAAGLLFAYKAKSDD
jgi:hypothetical protein